MPLPLLEPPTRRDTGVVEGPSNKAPTNESCETRRAGALHVEWMLFSAFAPLSGRSTGSYESRFPPSPLKVTPRRPGPSRQPRRQVPASATLGKK
ncbi:uncharacterized protein CTHT_0010230 [Thermochaetoides thermophila DSM 1495]|uniref:Uncharacterized protein n=1 Tax=Chaetomium thermophilum (strain DSM 1495 / CBS 144.50 / IMI 039719) TaxID=759272 RepID=G0S0J4_CHATD|nr:hypothetical protein CTHT_0010230 [Thermochaetoides thermophila DSM 1495]EGS23355.1 hypothetical protein CTHT_0010230 [Thermochaetoides thermophila DSM 1495]